MFDIQPAQGHEQQELVLSAELIYILLDAQQH
jgi:hypothetical protein